MKHVFPVYAVLVLFALSACQQGPTDTESQTTEAGPASVADAQLFTGKENQAVLGGYRIIDEGDHLQLQLTDDFKSDAGPDLHVVLSPVLPDDATGSNAMADGAAVILGKLQSLQGPQTYDVPPDVELGRFNSVLIQCVKYSHLYGAAVVE